jgi:microsomal dipeptidase-like Zn-dependent dipeptidase
VAAGLGLAAGAVGAGDALMARAERQFNRPPPPPRPVADAVRELHRELRIVDLHADSLLWGRDLLRRGDRGHVDIPRLIEGNVALQVLAASIKVPRNLNIERNDDRTDNVALLALAQRWPPSTWRSLLARALHLAGRAHRLAARSDGRFRIIVGGDDLARYLEQRATDPGLTAGLLAIEGAHALDDDPANLDAAVAAGYRMISPAHFFDTVFGGSAHGVRKGGLTSLGRELVARAEDRGVVVDVAHASAATIDDVLALARRPVVASHTGVRAICDNGRNLPDAQVRGIAGSGGVVGIGFWPTACGGPDPSWIARSIAHAASVAGPDHVALGSDWDGAVPVPFDAAGIVQLTGALLAEGFDRAAIAGFMGGNALRVLAQVLPAGPGRAADPPRPTAGAC